MVNNPWETKTAICLSHGSICRTGVVLCVRGVTHEILLFKNSTIMKTSKTPLAAFSLLVAITAFLVLGCKQGTQAQTKTSGDSGGFAVVELFTSEGCSSCPPADALMAEIAQGNANQSVYVLAYHVDYWNHLGWRDRFSDRQFTQRQRQYRSWLGAGSLYTPQVVINGTEEFVGSDTEAVSKGLAGARLQGQAAMLTLSARLEQGKAVVDYAYTAAGKGESTELVLALVQKAAQSRVRAGENMGRTLQHAQVVRQMVALPVDLANKKQTTLDLPADFNETGWEIIGFAQRLADGHVLAAARVNLATLKPATDQTAAAGK